MINLILDKLLEGINLSIIESTDTADLIMNGKVNNSQIAALLTAMKIKGETPEEIAGFAMAMRNNGIKISSSDLNTIDVCGTGGDNSGSFNISTAVAFVVAGAGVRVAKHGNRSITSKSGSSDVLSDLGVKIDLSPEKAEQALDEIGITFLFAPIYHPAMKNVAPVRVELKFKTIFNVLGPLTNPANTTKQMIGTYNYNIAEKMVKASKLLGMENVTFVCTNDQYDEITLANTSRLISMKDSEVITEEIDASTFGYKNVNLKEIIGSTPNENSKIILRLFSNPERNAHFNVVAANAAVALCTTGNYDNLEAAKIAAEDSILSGKALVKLKELIAFGKS